MRKKGTASSLESTHQVNLLRGVSIKDTTTNQLTSVRPLHILRISIGFDSPQ
jgi:hypothetical protein